MLIKEDGEEKGREDNRTKDRKSKTKIYKYIYLAFSKAKS